MAKQEAAELESLRETGRKLGEGSYGEVVEVRVRGVTYAAKKLHAMFYRRDVPPEETAAITRRFGEECSRILQHRNIVTTIGVHFHPRTRQPMLVMELLDASLRHYLEGHASVTPTVKYSILLDVATGLVYLHSRRPPLVHRDLTANNVLLALGAEIIAKIADLGQARVVDRNPAQLARSNPWSKVPGNVVHMPPEAFLDEPQYDMKLDVFSFGVVMLHTLTQEWPEPSSDRVPAPSEPAGYRMLTEIERRMKYLDKISGHPLQSLVLECLDNNAEKRPTTTAMHEVVEKAYRLLIPYMEETGEELGSGAYGTVVEVRVKGERYAGKRLHAALCGSKKDMVAISRRFEAECWHLSQLQHRNIITMIGIHVHPTSLQPTLVMELMDDSLSHYLQSHPNTPPTVKYSILLDVATGLVYLHSLPAPLGPIVHRDLTANNVLLAVGGKILAKIADLGQARILDKNPAQLARSNPWTGIPGNVVHMPPEAFLDEPQYDTKLDVFSFGVVMLHTLTQEWPEPSSDRVPAPSEPAGYRMLTEIERRVKYLDKISGHPLQSLITDCLNNDPQKRPTSSTTLGKIKDASTTSTSPWSTPSAKIPKQAKDPVIPQKQTPRQYWPKQSRPKSEKDKRWEIIQEIKKIQPEAGKNLKDLKIPETFYHLAGDVAKTKPVDERFKKVPVYELLVEHIRYNSSIDGGVIALRNAGPTLEGWKAASNALFRYALNLILAPKRPEFKKMKLSSSYYVYNISRNLHRAEKVFHAMGYKSTDKKEREGQDLVYEGEVNPVLVLETATDLLVMREEIGLIQNLVEHLIHEKRDEGVMLELVVSVRQNTNTYNESWAKMVQIGYAEDKSGIYANLPFIGALQNRGGSNRISEGTITVVDLHERYHQQQQQEQQQQEEQQQQPQQQALYANAPLLLQNPSRNVPAWKMFDNVPPSQHTQPSTSSFDPSSNLPPPEFQLLASTPASEYESGNLAHFIDTRSGGGSGRLSPLEEQLHGLGDLPDPLATDEQPTEMSEVMSSVENTRNYYRTSSKARSASGDSKASSVDLYSSGTSQMLDQAMRMKERDDKRQYPSSCATPHTQGAGYGTPPLAERPGHPLLQVQTKQEETARPIESDAKFHIGPDTSQPPPSHPVPKPRRPRPKGKSQSFDVLDGEQQEGEGGKTHRGMKGSMSSSNVQHSSQDRDQNLHKPTPRPRSRSPSRSPPLGSPKRPIPSPRSWSRSPSRSPPLGSPKRPIPSPRSWSRSPSRSPPGSPSLFQRDSSMQASITCQTATPSSPRATPHTQSASTAPRDTGTRAPHKEEVVVGIAPRAASKLGYVKDLSSLSNSSKSKPEELVSQDKTLTSHSSESKAEEPGSRQPSTSSAVTATAATKSREPSSRTCNPLTSSKTYASTAGSERSATASASVGLGLGRGRRRGHFAADKRYASVTGSTATAKSVDKCDPRESNLDQGHQSRQKISEERASLQKRDHVECPKPRGRLFAVSEKSSPHIKKSLNPETAAKEVSRGLEDTLSEIEKKYNVVLSDTWTCSYCTNLVRASSEICDVCGRDKHEKLATYV